MKQCNTHASCAVDSVLCVDYDPLTATACNLGQRVRGLLSTAIRHHAVMRQHEQLSIETGVFPRA